jgi:3-oxoacyl-[acyl-carrier-protein] synthase II
MKSQPLRSNVQLSVQASPSPRADERCAALNYLTGEVRSARPRLVMNNNFAFGGINTSLVFAHI